MAEAAIPILENYKNINEKAWKKAMGTVQKMSGKTGISEKIRAVEDGVKRVDYELLKPQSYTQGCITPEDFDGARQEARAYLDKSLAKIAVPLEQLSKHLKEKISEFKSSKVVPKSTIKFAEEMAKQAADFQDRLDKAFKNLDEEFDELVKQKLKSFNVAKGKLVEYDQTWDAAMKDLKSTYNGNAEENEKLAAYNTFRRRYIRGFATSLPFFAKLKGVKPHVANWKALSQDSADPTTLEKMGKLIEMVDKQATQLRKDLKKENLI